MDIKTLLVTTAKQLKTKNITSANLDAEVLLSWALRKPKTFLYTRPEYKLNKSETSKYKNCIKRRLMNEPVAYITGRKEFYGLDFFVSKHVLIPRPLTEQIIDQIKKLKKPSDQFTILDIGTGSGCIAITIAKLFPKATVIASDISKQALKIAHKNAKNNSVKVKFIKSNLLDSRKLKKLLPRVDLITANLPYITLKEYQKLSPDIRRYEPKQTLIADAGGWEYYYKLFKQLKNLKIKKTLGIIFESPKEKIVVKKLTNN